jgi:protein O-GlcNAcase / histone acetyltransferase
VNNVLIYFTSQVFRGGLIADLQRLIPVDSGNDLFLYKLPETPTLNLFTIRPYLYTDETDVYNVCHKTYHDGSDCTEMFPDSLQEIAVDRVIAPFVTLSPEFSMVVENNDKRIIGIASAALDSKLFYRSQEV